ncbi:MAG: exodeoxyribonuclease III [Bacilli bacterium]|jgi:exodeoxyribonuclease-3|nr:exodeoxyribonuclease III [Bacilli bacterium]
MKLMSFNVNSIRAYLKKDLTSQFQKYNPDILGLEELKLSDDKEFPFQDPARPYVDFTISKTRKGYSGTAVMAKEKPLSVHYGLENGEYDDEGRVIVMEYSSFYFIDMYVPNSGEGLKRLDYRMEFEEKLKSYLLSLMAKKPIIVTGDLNVSHQEIDLRHPESNHMSAGFTDQERGKFTSLLSIGLVDTFRSLHPEEKKYSYWSYKRNARETNAGWRLDYMLVSKSLFPKVRSSEILNDVFGSDHCPVLLDIDLSF